MHISVQYREGRGEDRQARGVKVPREAANGARSNASGSHADRGSGVARRRAARSGTAHGGRRPSPVLRSVISAARTHARVRGRLGRPGGRFAAAGLSRSTRPAARTPAGLRYGLAVGRPAACRRGCSIRVACRPPLGLAGRPPHVTSDLISGRSAPSWFSVPTRRRRVPPAVASGSAGAARLPPGPCARTARATRRPRASGTVEPSAARRHAVAAPRHVPAALLPAPDRGRARRCSA